MSVSVFLSILLVNKSKQSPGTPKTIRLIPVDWGSLSITDESDQAMVKSNMTMPVIIIIHAYHLIMYFLLRAGILLKNIPARVPVRKNITSIDVCNMIHSFILNCFMPEIFH